MRFKFLVFIAALGCVPAAAQAMPAEGNETTRAGRAHVQKEADGTYLYFGGQGSIAAMVPFDDKSTFPGLYRLEGREVQITGVVNGDRVITLTDPEQIKLID